MKSVKKIILLFALVSPLISYAGEYYPSDDQDNGNCCQRLCGCFVGAEQAAENVAEQISDRARQEMIAVGNMIERGGIEMSREAQIAENAAGQAAPYVVGGAFIAAEVGITALEFAVIANGNAQVVDVYNVNTGRQTEFVEFGGNNGCNNGGFVDMMAINNGFQPNYGYNRNDYYRNQNQGGIEVIDEYDVNMGRQTEFVEFVGNDYFGY